MAQLKDTLISGSLRVTDTIFSTNLNLSSLTASYAVLTDANKNLVSRGITNNTSATAVTASDNLITANTLYYHKGNSNVGMLQISTRLIIMKQANQKKLYLCERINSERYES